MKVIKRVNLECYHHKKTQKRNYMKGTEMLTNLLVVIILQCIRVLNYHNVYLNLTYVIC